jgi:hypothetical protein
MSAPTDIPASNAAAGGEPIGGSPGGGQGAADSSRGPTDYIQQVRTNPDFAEREVRNLKSRHDTLEAEFKKQGERLGSLSSYLDQGVTGDQLANYVQDYAAIYQDPELAKMIQEHKERKANGSSTKTSSDDDYLTPEEEKIGALETQLADLRTRLTRTESSFGVNHLRANLTGVADEIGLSPELHKRVMGEIEADIRVWGQNHAKGDAAAMNALTQLQGEKSQDFIRTMIMNKLKPDDLDEVARHRALRKDQNARRFETDGPPEVVTTGQEPPPDFSKFATAADAARWARENPGRHSSY